MYEVVGAVYHSSAAHHPAIIVDKKVAHYSKHPPLEIYVVHVLVFAVHGFQRGVLKQVVGVVAVACKHKGEIVQFRLHVKQLMHEYVVMLMCSHIDSF